MRRLALVLVLLAGCAAPPAAACDPVVGLYCPGLGGESDGFWFEACSEAVPFRLSSGECAWRPTSAAPYCDEQGRALCPDGAAAICTFIPADPPESCD